MLDRIRATEPAAWAEFVRAVLVALVAVGWVAVDEDTINIVVSVVSAVASVVLTRFVRKAVTPVGKLENPGH